MNYLSLFDKYLIDPAIDLEINSSNLTFVHRSSPLTALEKINLFTQFVNLKHVNMPLPSNYAIHTYKTKKSKNDFQFQFKEAQASGMKTISHCVESAPHSWPEFRKNISLFLRNCPRYQLNNDLSVYDTGVFQLPSSWNYEWTFMAAMQMFERHKLDLELTDQKVELSILLELQQSFKQMYKQTTPVKLGVVLESNALRANQALLNFFHDLLENRIPILTNLDFIRSKHEEINNSRKRFGYELYIQKNGGLILLKPEKTSFAQYGIAPDSFEICEKSLLDIEKRKFDYSKDLKSVLLLELERKKFSYLIAHVGHGLYPSTDEALDVSKEGRVGGLTRKEFNSGLDAERERNCVFKSLSSCYSGGLESQHIQSAEGIIPFPIFLMSPFETVTFSNNVTSPSKILSQAQKILYPPSIRGVCLKPQQMNSIHRKSFESIKGKAPNPHEEFANLGLLLLATPEKSVPKRAYEMTGGEYVLDVSKEYRKRNFSHGTTSSRESALLPLRSPLKLLEDKQTDTKAYLFSEPILPFNISTPNKLPMILLSRGSNNIHVIREIDACHQDFLSILKETFNAFQFQKMNCATEPASKLFMIGKMKCSIKGTVYQLNHVVIIQRNDFREAFYQIEGEEGYTKISFSKNDPSKTEAFIFSLWDNPKETFISSNDAIVCFYKLLLMAMPSLGTLEQTTSGMVVEEDILEAFENYFFPEGIPFNFRLYSAIARDLYKCKETKSITSSHFEKFLKNLSQRNIQFELLYERMKSAKNIINVFNNTDYWKKIANLIEPSLFAFVRANNFNEVRKLVEEDPRVVHKLSIMKANALMVAFTYGFLEIASYLVDNGIDLNIVSEQGFSMLPCSMKSVTPELLDKMIKKGLNIKAEYVPHAIEYGMRSGNLPAVEYLLDHKVGEEKFKEILLIISSIAKDGVLIRKLLKYSKRDFECQTPQTLQTPLHLCIFHQNVEGVQILVKESSKDKKDKEGRTPLHYAVLCGNAKSVELAKILLDEGADINAVEDNGNSALHLAITKEDKIMIEMLILRGASYILRNDHELSPLELAEKCPDIFDFMAKLPGVNINLPDKDGLTVLHRAIIEGHQDRVTHLINLGGDINATVLGSPFVIWYLNKFTTVFADGLRQFLDYYVSKGGILNNVDKNGNSCAHVVVQKKFSPDVLKAFSDNGVRLHSPRNNDGFTPYELIFKMGFHPLLKSVIDNDPDILQRDLLKMITLLLSAQDVEGARYLVKKVLSRMDNIMEFDREVYNLILDNEHEKVIELLRLNPGIVVQDLYGMPIHLIWMAFVNNVGDSNTLEFLVKHTKSVNRDSRLPFLEKFKNLEPKVALDWARQYFYTDGLFFENFDLEFLKGVMQFGSNFSSALSERYMRSALVNNKIECVEWLLNDPMSCSPSKFDSYFLMVLITKNRDDKIRKLFQNHPKINVNAKSNNGMSALSLALSFDKKEYVSWLVSRKAEFATPNFASPYNQVILSDVENKASYIEIFLKGGYDVNAMNREGYTPAHFAVEKNDSISLRKLIKCSANLTIPNKDGFTPLQLAEKLRFGACVELIRQHS